MIFIRVFSAFTGYALFRVLVFYRHRNLNFRRKTMWTKPTATDLRFGFEVTMYIAAK